MSSLHKSVASAAGVFLSLFLPVGYLPAAAYTNPVIAAIGPADPTVIRYNGVYYMYPTEDNTSYHVYTSDDMVHWQKGPEVFVPGGSGVWAPDVFYNASDGKFYMYYTAGGNIGVAVSDAPDGTFVNQGVLLNGFIDAHLFRNEDGRCYLYFAASGCIYVQEMENLLQLKGSMTLVLQADHSWEKTWGNVNEGPWMLKHEGVYYLMYSGTGANSQYYAVGYATATNPMGPFTKYAGNPIIKRGNGVYGPGHGSVTTDGLGNLWHIYHQKNTSQPGWDRFICIDPLWFDTSGVLHGQATRGTAEPAPLIFNIPADGLIIHLDAGELKSVKNGGSVTSWADSAVSDAVNGTVSKIGTKAVPTYQSNVLNGRPVVRFTGSQVLGSASFSCEWDTLTVFAVLTGGKTATASERAWQVGSSAGSSGQYVAFDASTNVSNSTNPGSGARFTNGRTLVRGALDTGFHTVMYRIEQGGKYQDGLYCVDGLTQEIWSHTLNPANKLSLPSTGNVFTVGCGPNYLSADFYKGDIAEIMVYNRMLTAGEMVEVWDYLDAKYFRDFTPPSAAINPDPADSADDVSIDAVLSWTAGSAVTSHDIYFGSKNPPPFVQNQTASSYQPPAMNTGTAYYWRVDEQGYGGAAPGELWSFTTAGADITPAGWWMLDESSGTAAYDSAGSNDGYVKGAVWENGCLHFDGVNDNVQIKHDASLDIVSAASLAFWVKFDTVPQTRKGIVSKSAYNATAGWSVWQEPTGKILVSQGMAGAVQKNLLTTQSPLGLNQWYHIVYVADIYSGEPRMRLFVNGVQSAVLNTSNTSFRNSTQALWFASQGSGYYFDGSLDDVRFYGGALPDSGILQLYQSGAQ